MGQDRLRRPGIAFYLSQLGGQSQREWTRRLGIDGLEPREVMLFRFVALADGHTQREVARAIGLPASRIVGLVDRLEQRGWIERRPAAGDRRIRTLHVTSTGREMLERIMAVSIEHEAAMTRGIDAEERAILLDLLTRLADAQGLVSGAHPGFADPRADQEGHPERLAGRASPAKAEEAANSGEDG